MKSRIICIDSIKGRNLKNHYIIQTETCFIYLVKLNFGKPVVKFKTIRAIYNEDSCYDGYSKCFHSKRD